MPLDINPDHPLESLEALGCTVRKTDTSNTTSFNLGGIPVSSNTSYGAKYDIGLPQQLTVKATFSPEGLSKKFLKVFTSELQTGDEVFDPAVFIATNDQDRTGEFLADELVRDAIFGIVGPGGTVALAGAHATFAFVDEPDRSGLAAMARILVAAT